MIADGRRTNTTAGERMSDSRASTSRILATAAQDCFRHTRGIATHLAATAQRHFSEEADLGPLFRLAGTSPAGTMQFEETFCDVDSRMRLNLNLPVFVRVASFAFRTNEGRVAFAVLTPTAKCQGQHILVQRK